MYRPVRRRTRSPRLERRDRLAGWPRARSTTRVIAAVDRASRASARWYVRHAGRGEGLHHRLAHARPAHAALRDLRDAGARGEPGRLLRAPAAAQRRAGRRPLLDRGRGRRVPPRRAARRPCSTRPSSTACSARCTPPSSAASAPRCASASPSGFASSVPGTDARRVVAHILCDPGRAGSGKSGRRRSGSRVGRKPADAASPLRDHRCRATRACGAMTVRLTVFGGGNMGAALAGRPGGVGLGPGRRPGRGGTGGRPSPDAPRATCRACGSCAEPRRRDGRGRAGGEARRHRRRRPRAGGRGRRPPGAVDRRRRAHAGLEAALGAGAAVVRAMPNTPALVRAGAAAIAPGRHAGDDDLDWAEGILGAVGTVVRVPEHLLDAVTGLSGSGPAYVFLVAEALIEAGSWPGCLGTSSAQLTDAAPGGLGRPAGRVGPAPEQLRAASPRPGGTTAAGLRALERAGRPGRLPRRRRGRHGAQPGARADGRLATGIPVRNRSDAFLMLGI